MKMRLHYGWLKQVFDLILPRVLTGEKISKADFIELGHGGLCLECKPCSFPHCSFGKGETFS